MRKMDYAYDANGNLTTNGTRFFEYDNENQLTRITEPNAWKSEFSYDGKMRRRITKEYIMRILTILICVIFTGCLHVTEMRLDSSEVKAIAEKYVLNRRFLLDSYDVPYVVPHLETRRWTVIYELKKKQIGGDVRLIVDDKTKQVKELLSY